MTGSLLESTGIRYFYCQFKVILLLLVHRCAEPDTLYSTLLMSYLALTFPLTVLFSNKVQCRSLLKAFFFCHF